MDSHKPGPEHWEQKESGEGPPLPPSRHTASVSQDEREGAARLPLALEASKATQRTAQPFLWHAEG